MKYAIYDKAADGYLTKMEFDFDTPDNQMLTSTGYTEYIIDAQLLDTKESAVGMVTRIESCKFMEKGRFVIHSFNEKLADQYIISETGNPTKVVDSITVDLDGNINVKYGTMLTHWSSKFLEYAITRMNALQKAKSTKYTAWCNTFDIYKVIPVTDERSCGHYQFIKVTTKGLEEYAKNEVDPLNKRIMVVEKCDMNKEIKELCDTRGSIAEVMFAIRNAIYNNNSGAFDCIESRMEHESIFNSSPFMAGVRENIKDICDAEKRNIANHDLKNSEIARLANEKKQALERAEFYKRQANSVYGMTVPTRCCGKQLMADILSGKKIPVNKKKYDDLVEYVANINLTYDSMFCMMDKPVYLSTITESLNNLTK